MKQSSLQPSDAGHVASSDSPLWACASAELLFTPAPSPGFGGAAPAAAITELGRRHRRPGGLAGVTRRAVAS